MTYTIRKQYAVVCGNCGKERAMVDVEHELGSELTIIARWCACPIEELIKINEARERELEAEPDHRRRAKK